MAGTVASRSSSAHLMYHLAEAYLLSAFVALLGAYWPRYHKVAVVIGTVLSVVLVVILLCAVIYVLPSQFTF